MNTPKFANLLADDYRKMLRLDDREAVSNCNFVFHHALTGPHREFKANTRVRVGDDLTIRSMVARLELRQTSRKRDSVARESQVAGAGSKHRDGSGSGCLCFLETGSSNGD